MGRQSAIKRSSASIEAHLETGPRIEENAPKAVPDFKNILVCTDFSPVSNLAVNEAVRLCREMAAQITLLHIFEYGLATSRREELIEPAATMRSKECEHLSEILAEVRGKEVAAKAVLQDGVPAEEILKLIDQQHFDLAVVGTHGFSGVERMVFGSTAERVFRKAHCPVVTVGPCVAARRDSAGVGPVIFATDFQRPMATAVRYAAALANSGGDPLHCINVLPLPMENDGDASIVPQIMMEALHQLIPSEDGCVAKPTCAIIYGSEVSHAIVDYAKAQRAKLIVLGVRRKSQITHHLPPHVTYRTIVTAPCPVLTVSYDHD